MQHLLPALRSHVWFASCSHELQQALLQHASVVSLQPGDRLFGRADLDEGLCCVLSGALRLGSFNPQDESHVLTVYVEPYQWVGEISMIDGLARSQEAVADVESQVLVVSRAGMERWLEQHPAHWRELARLACLKVRLMVLMLEDNATLPLEQRVARRLVMTSTNFGMTHPLAFRRHVRLSQEYLARMLGVSRQTVNRALKGLSERGIIQVHYADIELLDIDGLLSVAGPVDPGLIEALRTLGRSADVALRGGAA